MKTHTMVTRWLALFATFAALHAAGCAATDEGPAPAPAPDAAEAADQAPDAEVDEQAATCGGRTCAAGTVCCDPFCGKCVPKGMECTLGCGGGV